MKTTILLVPTVEPAGTAKKTATSTRITMTPIQKTTRTWKTFMTWTLAVYAALLGGFLLALIFGGC